MPEYDQKFRKLEALSIEDNRLNIPKHATLDELDSLARQWADKEYLVAAMVDNPDAGKPRIKVNKRSIEDVIGHKPHPLLYRILPYCNQLLKTSFYAGEGYRQGGFKTHLYANKVNIDGKEYAVLLIAKENENGLRLYDIELSEIYENIQPAFYNPGKAFELFRARLGVKSGQGATKFQLAPPNPANPNAPQLIMGAYTPGDNSIIRIFQGHDHTTVMHEIGHHIWQIRRELATGGKSDKMDKERWLALERHYGVEPGGEWSRAQHEAFAHDFVGLYLIGHREPPIELAALFASMREEMLQLYETADSLEMEMSPASREVFNRALTGDLAEAQYEFAAAIADLNTRRPERMFVSDKDLGPREFGPELDSVERLRQLTREAEEEVERMLVEMEGKRPELARKFREEHMAEMAELERQRQVLKQQAEIMPDLVAYYLENDV